jgi:molybdopterin converting factor small subunit
MFTRWRPSSWIGEPAMIVYIPTPLRSYTDHRSQVEAEGATLGALLEDLDRRHPGIRFRMVDEQECIRPHMRVFVNKSQVKDLATELASTDEVQILQALSGG